MRKHERFTPLHATAVTPVVVAYDIADNRRRSRLHRLLRGFGEPMQKSVFVCWLDERRRQRLEQVLGAFRDTPHKGHERIDCVIARHLPNPPPAAWVLE